ncbi:hypothetical protein NO1_1932 [Candidatus Termititenax aidoneus]|uniref:Phage tail protein n=1 Tax=Termititenax aidoneus TaxID=2218524 RepID=A0A388TE00_TERA1|nr:hypothetical protein NO1_1932 [Candidatus Termititenax aidoneus]
MGSVSLTGKDSIILDGRPIVDVGDGDVANLEFPNDIVAVKTGKNGNSIYAFNATGNMSTLTLRVLVGSADDKWLNSRFYEYKNDPPAFITFDASFVKRAGDGKGNIAPITYTMSGGIITRLPAAKENAEGDTEQAVAVYTISFTNADRSL